MVGVIRSRLDLRTRAARLANRPLVRMNRNFFEQPTTYFRGRWDQLNDLNVPGAFYGADTDTTGEGPWVAPASVALDGIGQAFVWRQPRGKAEIHALMTAASSDPFAGYGWDGDDHWSPDLVASWWDRRHARRAQTEQAVVDLRHDSPERADEFWMYATSGAESDLERYAAYLAGRR